ncbi:hypothetical protein [Phytohabitans kaempferiae]|uniref:Amidohydrolase-related domain-containing protein n=1 Tax=Phytohabitans kaempferiae TaxID=1620943 RepID=A0ABV6MCX3_9ACTN
MTEPSIAWDVDVLFGKAPKHDVDASVEAVSGSLAGHGVAGAFACSLRGALYQAGEGNDETLAAARAAAAPRLVPVGTVDCRDALVAEAEVARLADAGVRVVRLFPVEQGAEPEHPGFRHIVDVSLAAGMTILTEGDVRRFWMPFADRGARVCFLDVHAYHVADFVLLARREPGFVASTRLLNSPDSIERIAGEVGAGHLAYGSRAPLHAVGPAALRLRRAALAPAEWAMVAGGTAAGWLEAGTP